MSGIDGTRTAPRTGRRALVGSVLLAGALLGAVAQPAYAAPAPASAAAVVITCGG